MQVYLHITHVIIQKVVYEEIIRLFNTRTFEDCPGEWCVFIFNKFESTINLTNCTTLAIISPFLCTFSILEYKCKSPIYTYIVVRSF